MATVTGYVERIKYRNEDNGYSVLSVADGGEEYILVGTFPYISEGERIEATISTLLYTQRRFTRITRSTRRQRQRISRSSPERSFSDSS